MCKQPSPTTGKRPPTGETNKADAKKCKTTTTTKETSSNGLSMEKVKDHMNAGDSSTKENETPREFPEGFPVLILEEEKEIKWPDGPILVDDSNSDDDSLQFLLDAFESPSKQPTGDTKIDAKKCKTTTTTTTTIITQLKDPPLKSTTVTSVPMKDTEDAKETSNNRHVLQPPPVTKTVTITKDVIKTSNMGKTFAVGDNQVTTTTTMTVATTNKAYVEMDASERNRKYGPRTSNQDLPTNKKKIPGLDYGYGRDEHAHQRILYSAKPKETVESIANTFQVPINKILYDNKLRRQSDSPLPGGFPIILPLQWDGKKIKIPQDRCQFWKEYTFHMYLMGWLRDGDLVEELDKVEFEMELEEGLEVELQKALDREEFEIELKNGLKVELMKVQEQMDW